MQSAYQKGDALTAAGTATVVTNAVPIAAGFVLFGETLPHGIRAVAQIMAFACLILSAVALGRPDAPGAAAAPAPSTEAAGESRLAAAQREGRHPGQPAFPGVNYPGCLADKLSRIRSGVRLLPAT